MILQIFHTIALTLLQISSLFAVCSYLKHSNTGEIARAEKRRSMINILVKLCSLAHQEGTPNNPKHKNPPTVAEGFVLLRNYLLCSQTWLPTVQEVLQADWQEAGHSPQPPVRRVFFSIALLTVWICFLMCITSKSKYYYSYILPCFAPFCKSFF